MVANTPFEASQELAAAAAPQSTAPQTATPIAGGAIARLKSLHAEAEETARLANILGRSLYVGVALPVMAILTMGLSVDVPPAPQLTWLLFVGAIALGMLVAYRHSMRQPFERTSLKTFAKDLSAILLFGGFAWGAGAFLALPVATPATAALLFAATPAVIIASLLRDRDALVLFLTPSAALTAAACLLKPFSGGLWLAMAVVAASALIAGAAILYDRLTGERSKPAMLSLP